MSGMYTVLQGDCLASMRSMDAASVQCCVTSPPYWGLRDYGVDGQIGLEETPAVYVAKMVDVFAEVWRVLKDDGTLWLNLGDSYASNWPCNRRSQMGAGSLENGKREARPPRIGDGLKDKDLVGIPWRVAFGLQEFGWYLRSDTIEEVEFYCPCGCGFVMEERVWRYSQDREVIWAKPNCMPESVRDRPTRSHEYMFILSKRPKYYYDAEAIKEAAIYDVDGTGTASRKARASEDLKSHPNGLRAGIRPAGFKDAEKMNGKNGKQRGHSRRHDGFNDRWDAMEKVEQCTGMRNKRDVWTVSPACYPEAHFATFPPDLIKPCILAGSRPGDTILDPFGGSGTTGQVAIELGRRAILCELNPQYVELIHKRCNVTPGLPI